MRQFVICCVLLPALGGRGLADSSPVPTPPISIHFHSQFVKADRDAVALRAVDALANKEKFAAAEVLSDGNVFGWNDKASALVIIQPFRDGVHFSLFVAGRDNEEAGRLRNAIRGHLLASGPTADVPRSVRREDGVPKPPVALKHGADSRNATPILRFFQPAGFIVMEKHGLSPSDAGMPNTPTAFGGSATRMAAAFALPGPNEIGVRIYSVVAAADDDEADRLQRAIRQDMLKVLFE